MGFNNLTKLHLSWHQNWPAFLPRKPYYPFGKIPITDYLVNRARLTPNKPVINYYGRELTFQELNTYSDIFATYLAELGLGKGDRVAVYLSNCPQSLILFYGILKSGCIYVPVNPMFKQQELLYELEDSEPKVIITLEELYPIVNSLKDTSIQHVVTTCLLDFLPEKPALPLHRSMLKLAKKDCPGAVDLLTILKDVKAKNLTIEPNLDDPVSINYTGGTTGIPKGCLHTHYNLLYTAATGSTYVRRMFDSDVVLSYTPVFWIAGEVLGILLPVFTGNTTILLSRWDVEAVLEAIPRYKITLVGGVLDNFIELMEHPDVGKCDLSSIRDISVASFVKKTNIHYRQQWNEVSKGKSVLREATYGLTETHTYDTFTTGLQVDDMDLKSKPVFCGLPVPDTEFLIVDFDTKEQLALEDKGEIIIRSPSIMENYWNNPGETGKAIRDGWFHTGDMGMLDKDGYLHFLGRNKEMLKVKGMSVFPSELEVLICKHPKVEACGVVGKDDKVKGQVPIAFIKLHQGAFLTESEMERWCHDSMAVYKVPIVRFVNEFPLTATGKIKKDDLAGLV